MAENVCKLLDNLSRHNSRAYGYELSQNEVLQILKLFDDVKELEQYRAIGTIDEFKALKEKSVAKKPILKTRGVYDEDNEDYLGEEEYTICPSCEIRWEVFKNQTHCRRCGQKLDWS